MSPAARLEALLGTWVTTRVIRHRDGTTARFEGTTVWRPEGEGVLSVETGQMALGIGQPVTATRTTRWFAKAGQIEVTFADGRPFHTIDGAEAFHDCPPDAYHLRYDFSAWPRWSVRWRVEGPRKDYRALTRYHRA